QHRVGTIGALSLRQRPTCSITVPRPTLFTNRDSTAFERDLAECTTRMRELGAEPYTDISGALEFAALSIKGERKALRGIVLITDLDQDIAGGNTAAEPNLRGICVAVFTMMTSQIARQPELRVERERLWNRQLRAWSARQVRFESTLGLDPQELAS